MTTRDEPPAGGAGRARGSAGGRGAGGARSPGGAGRGALPLLVALLVSAPVLVGLGYALAGAAGLVGPGTGGGPGRILFVLGEPAVWEGLAWSVWVAAAATALAAAGAVAVAVLFRGDGRLDGVARGLAVLPLPVPHIVAAVVGLLVLGQSGLLARLGHALGLVPVPAAMPALVYDRAGIGLILSMAWKELPFLALIAFTVLASRGAALEETARSLGAGAWQTFRRVTWPVLWRGMLPGATAAFIFVAGTYEATALLAPSDPLALPLLQMERYTHADLERRADAYVIVLVMLGLAAIAVAVHEWARARSEEVVG